MLKFSSYVEDLTLTRSVLNETELIIEISVCDATVDSCCGVWLLALAASPVVSVAVRGGCYYMLYYILYW